MKKTILLFASGFALFSCTPKTVEIIEDAESLEFPNDNVKQGYALYSANCGQCHGLKHIPDYSQERWDEVLPPMADKAKLDDESEAKIAEYITWVLNN